MASRINGVPVALARSLPQGGVYLRADAAQTFTTAQALQLLQNFGALMNFKAVTYAATLSLSLATSFNNVVVLNGGNITFTSPTGVLNGATYLLYIKQDSIGSRLATWTSSVFDWGAAGAPVLSTAPNVTDIIRIIADSGKLRCSLVGKGFNY